MAGHGSAPDPDRALDPNRQVHRDSGMMIEESDLGRIEEYRPPLLGPDVPHAKSSLVSPRGTRYAWSVGGGAMEGGRGGSVRSVYRARTAIRNATRRQTEGRDPYTGR
jgi:hypothetical protein